MRENKFCLLLKNGILKIKDRQFFIGEVALFYWLKSFENGVAYCHIQEKKSFVRERFLQYLLGIKSKMFKKENKIKFLKEN